DLEVGRPPLAVDREAVDGAATAGGRRFGALAQAGGAARNRRVGPEAAIAAVRDHQPAVAATGPESSVVVVDRRNGERPSFVVDRGDRESHAQLPFAPLVETLHP